MERSRTFTTTMVLAIFVASCTPRSPAPPAPDEPVFFADESISLGYETRAALSTDAAFEVQLPEAARLGFAIATREPADAVRFRIRADDAVVFDETLATKDGNHWWDQEPIDLSEWAGDDVELVFETDGAGLWGNPRIETRAPEGPHVILISIDCLRADHVGTYGYSKPTTPSIDGFAHNAVVFDNAVSASSWTIPSHMSMFTGLPPMVHGVNDSPDNFWAGTAKTLPPSVPYLAELLSRHGYETGAVVSSAPMSPLYGFERGFGVYRVHADKAEEVVDSALDLVARSHQRPFFLFVHFIDPHWPYMPMVEFRSYAAEFIERFGDRPRDISELIKRHQGKAVKALPEDAVDIQTLYDAALAYVDRELGRFFTELKRQGIYDDALILLTGDHGEGFYDHETFGHAKTLYQELTHVPLIVKWPRGASSGRVDAPVSHVDIFPTILEAAGLTAPPAEGVSLASAPSDREIVGDASWEDRLRSETMLSVRRGRYKYIAAIPFAPFEELSLEALISEELYDLASDPKEAHNLIEEPPIPLAPFRERLETYLSAAKLYRAGHEGGAIALDEDTRRSLEALGYISR
jgi:arylsulfatase A-like enzyme